MIQKQLKHGIINTVIVAFGEVLFGINTVT